MGQLTEATSGNNPAPQTHLSLIIYNTECIRNNLIYATEVIKGTDILLIQEHWLFQAEVDAKQLDKIFPDHDHHAKAVDVYNPLPPTAKVRGYGGVATLWPTQVSPLIRRLPDGNNRIVAITLNTTRPICIINVYMPSGNSAKNSGRVYGDLG